MVKKKEVGLSSKTALYMMMFLIVINVVLAGLSVAKSRGMFIPGQPEPIIKEGVIDLDDLTLEQKIGQMTVVIGIRYYAEALKNMQIGGVHLHAMEEDETFKERVDFFQSGTIIPFFVTVDLEGCVNPFVNFREFPAVSEVSKLGEAFEKGKTEGKFLRELGITVDFAPVVDLEDNIWNCRSFPGTKEEITELANAYILGMQDEGILATAKHYPGKTLVIKDPHQFLAAAEITEDDLYPYQELVRKGNVQAIMVSHIITYGEVNSEGKPSVTSKKIMDQLRNEFGFDGLIISDEINMQGVKKFYDSLNEMYIDVFKAGSDMVLNFNQDPNEIHNMITTVAQAVEEGEIDEDRIDASVRRILEAKGFVVED